MVTSAPIISYPSRCSIDASRHSENPIYHSAQSRNLLLPPMHPCRQQSEFEMQVGGRRAAPEMRTQRLSRGLLATAQRAVTDASWQVTRSSFVQMAALYGNGEAVRMEGHCFQSHERVVIGRSHLKPQRISGTRWDKVAVALCRRGKSIGVFLTAILEQI